MTDSQGAVKLAPKIDQQQVEQDASWLGKRLSEPSTYAGLGVLLALIFHVSNADHLAVNLQTIGIALGTILLAVLAIIKPEAANRSYAKTGGVPVDKAVAIIALCVLAGLLAQLPSAEARMAKRTQAAASMPLPSSDPRGLYDTTAAPSGKPTVTQAQQNPLLVLQQFTVEDLQAALKDAQSQTPPDTTSANCYQALIPFVQQQTQNPLPSGAGIFQALQKTRDAKAYLANIQSPTGPLAGLNQACAPLVLDVQNTLLTLGVQVGVLANPAGGGLAAVAGLPAAVQTFLNLLPKP